MEKGYQFDCHMSVDDFVAFNEHSLKYTKYGRKTMHTVRMFFLVLGFFAIGMIWLSSDAHIVLKAVVTFLLGVVIALLMVFALKLQVSGIRTKVEKNDKYKKDLYSENATIIFGEDSLIDRSPEKEIKVLYDALEKVYITNRGFYFYYSYNQAIVVTSESFRDYQQMIEFAVWIKEKIGPEKVVG